MGRRSRDNKSAFEQAKDALRSMGLVLTRRDGEYRVNYAHGDEATAYYTTDLDDACATAAHMPARQRCNCENSACSHRAGGCRSAAGRGSIAQLGPVCNSCYHRYPDQYRR